MKIMNNTTTIDDPEGMERELANIKPNIELNIPTVIEAIIIFLKSAVKI